MRATPVAAAAQNEAGGDGHGNHAGRGDRRRRGDRGVAGREAEAALGPPPHDDVLQVIGRSTAAG